MPPASRIPRLIPITVATPSSLVRIRPKPLVVTCYLSMSSTDFHSSHSFSMPYATAHAAAVKVRAALEDSESFSLKLTDYMYMLFVQVYRTKYQATQNGQIGIVLSTEWKEAMCKSEEDKAAAERNLVW